MMNARSKNETYFNLHSWPFIGADIWREIKQVRNRTCIRKSLEQGSWGKELMNTFTVQSGWHKESLYIYICTCKYDLSCSFLSFLLTSESPCQWKVTRLWALWHYKLLVMSWRTGWPVRPPMSLEQTAKNSQYLSNEVCVKPVHPTHHLTSTFLSWTFHKHQWNKMSQKEIK